MAAVDMFQPFGLDGSFNDADDDFLTAGPLDELFDEEAHYPDWCYICNTPFFHCTHLGALPPAPSYEALHSLPPDPETTSSASSSSSSSSSTILSALSSHTFANSNASGPLPSSQQEMESSGAGALALQAAPLPENSYTPHTRPTDRLTMMPELDVTDFTFDDDTFFPDSVGQQPLGGPFDTPHHALPVNHFDASNVRGGAEDVEVEELQQHASPTSTNAALAANTLTTFHAQAPPLVTDGSSLSFKADDGFEQPLSTRSGPVCGRFEDGPEYFDEDDLHDMQAFAKLAFEDGDYFVSTLEVVVGRDQDYLRELHMERVRELKRRRARGELDGYRQEPSAPSQPGNGDNGQDSSSKSNQSLEGRPAKALPSNYSEQGGAVSYEVQSDEETQLRKAQRKTKRKRYHATYSSSSTSIAPANLHPSLMGDFSHPDPFSEADGKKDALQEALVPIHPINPDEIKLISKRHLLFRYDSQEECWMLEVLGSWVTVNDVQYNRHDVIRLSHWDRIQVFSVEIVFKLPIDASRELSPGLSHGPFADDLEGVDEHAEVVQDLSDDEEGEEEVPETDAMTKKKKGPTLKLGRKKSAQQEKVQEKDAEKPAKARKKKEGTLEQSPEAVKKVDKGKKPMAAAKEPAETAADQEVKAEKAVEKASPPEVPINIQPGSVLAGLAPDQLPQKRKGPGRPPKNGLISKRDEAFIKRKQKDLEKQGLPIPAMDELLAIVRAENKQREAMQKAIANGQQPPADMLGVVQSIELDPALQSSSRPPAGADAGMTMKIDADGDGVTSGTPGEALRRPSSPKPKRVAKSPSPVPPESEYTEEQLKKPSQTYVHILDEILRDIGKGDLQEIYDKIMKKYPYYKYRVNTPGWQSSVRHNLLQNNRFKEDGRSGKGKLWAINFDVPLEREKKRRPTPPPRPQMPMQQMHNGQWPPHMGPYGQPAYPGYGQPGVNGMPPQQFPPGHQAVNGVYASPYAPSQGYGPPPMGQPGMPHQPYPAGATPGASQTPHRQQGSATPAPRSQFQGIVDEIMHYRTTYLRPFPPNSAEFLARSELFSNCTNSVSNRFHGMGDAQEQEVAQGEEERTVCAALEAIMEKWKHLKDAGKSGSGQGTPAAAEGSAAASNDTGPQQTAASGVIEARAAEPQQVVQPSGTDPSTAQSAAPDAGVVQEPVPALTSVPPAAGANEQSIAEAQPLQQPPALAPPAEPAPQSQANGTKRAAEEDTADGDEQDSKRLKTL